MRMRLTTIQLAYNYFNNCLFGGKLPSCLLILQRKSTRVLGYFSPQRFDRVDGAKTDKRTMNPMHFRASSAEEVLSTLAHEMIHV